MPDPLIPDEMHLDLFRMHLEVIGSNFNVLPLLEAIERHRTASLPPRTACITFDDGYADNAEIALPELQKRDMPATIFVASDFLDGGSMWNDRIIDAVRTTREESLDLTGLGLQVHPVNNVESRQELVPLLIDRAKYLPPPERHDFVSELQEQAAVSNPQNMMLTSEQLRMLSDGGMEIGGHTVTHPILGKLSVSEAETEIAGGRDRLEEIIGAPVRLFAYPNGKPGDDYRSEHVDIVRRLGFWAAVSTSWGVARRDADYYQIPRFTPWDTTPLRFALRVCHNAIVNHTSLA